jgi:hypothetical protein
VAIRFQCPKCDRQLSIGSRKAGTTATCPHCGAHAPVPDDAPGDRVARVVLLCVGGTALVACAVVGLVLSQRERAEPAREVARAEPIAPAAPHVEPPTPKVEPPAPAKPGIADFLPQMLQQFAPKIEPQPQPAPEPQPSPEQPPPKPPVPPKPVAFDNFGNPVGAEFGLAQDGEFKGMRVLFWSGFENAGRVFFHPTNPLWKALEAKGFVVSRAFGKFDPAWLKNVDQLWVLSTGRLNLPDGITPDLLELGVAALPASAVPSGFTLPEYQFVVRATLDVALGPTHPLTAKDCDAIEAFARAGGGLCLLAEDEPFTREADELARRLFGARVSGNYRADRVAFVRNRGLTPADVKRFGGQFEAADHPLLAGVNFVFEGITVSHVTKSEKLDVALAASDGKALVAVSKVPGVRAVIDCGFTRYCHGPTERTSYVLKTAGTVRLAQNVAAHLAGKGAPK